METALASLYLKLTRIPEIIDNVAAYGHANRQFHQRVTAIQRAAQIYFVRTCDQEKEGQLVTLLGAVQLYAIERHRIAHGYIVQSGKLDTAAWKKGATVLTDSMYRWGTPFYAMDNLRHDPLGRRSDEIEEWTQRFTELHLEIVAFNDSLQRQP